MKKLFFLNAAIFFLVVMSCNMSVANENTTAMPTDSTKKGLAVLELFTSEGCSSCPPADALLAKLSKEYNGKVYALGFHVDYWNRLGWIDSFSNADYSRRQENYATQFHLNSIYTPQLVINGKSELVGSDERKARIVLANELENTTTASVQLQAKQNENGISVSYTIEKYSNDVLNIALVKLNANTNVKNGENGGHVLHHINVVRDFKTIDISKNNSGTSEMDIPKGFAAKDYKIIAYLQHKNDLSIEAASQCEIQ